MSITKDDDLGMYIAQATEAAQRSGIPRYVVYNGGYAVISVRAYKAIDHGVVEAVRYPENYVYPFDRNEVLDEGMSTW